jgi:pimeloyl-ACP methyl ester carboxylesterase
VKHADLMGATQGRLPAGFREVHRIQDEVRRVVFATRGDVLLVVFWQTLGMLAGGRIPSDWLANFKGWKKSFSVESTKYRAHAGFVAEYLSLREDLLGMVKTYQPAEVVLVGFSQGSAHATLAFRDLLVKGGPLRIEAVVFGAPRVYDSWSAAEFNHAAELAADRASFHRVTTYRDLVARLAPWWLDYSHVGPEIVLGGRRWWLFGDIKKHEPARYMDALEEEGL